MLNRRTLRIKIMQSLFAYGQCKDADFELAQDLIEERFQPDLNSMEPQDKALLTKQKKTALPLLIKKIEGKELKSDDPKVLKAVEDAFLHFQNLIRKDQLHLAKNIIAEIEKLSATYHSVISLMLAFADLAADEKKVNHSNFINHPWITAFRNHAELKKAILLENAGWESRMDKVRSWYREVVKVDQTYLDFISEKKPNEESQKALIKHLSRKIILGAGVIHDYFEEQNIRWAEDKDIIKSLMDKTIKSFADGKITLQKISLDWEDDKEFVNKLFHSTIDLDPQYKDLIAKNTRNWEVDRLPLTDRVVLEMAITEMIHFPNIPVKVTINEYIELSKNYSTPKSRQFINGILDVISKAMKESGAVKKSGRGLIDNK
jgi:N utilization substance protein B